MDGPVIEGRSSWGAGNRQGMDAGINSWRGRKVPGWVRIACIPILILFLSSRLQGSGVLADSGWGTPANVSDSVGSSGSPSLAIGSQGQVHLAWHDYTPGKPDIYYTSKPLGQPWLSVENASRTPRYSRSPSLAIDQTGVLHLAWEDDSLTDGPTEILYAIRSADGAWSDPVNVSQSAGASSSPSILVNDAGVHIAWQEYISDSYQIHCMHKPWAADWGAAVNVSQSSGYAANPQIVAGPGGALHLTWEEYISSNYEIMYATSSPGDPWGAPINVSANLGDSTNPAAAVDHVGTVHILWRDSSASRTDIFYASRGPDGVWSRPENIHPSSALSGAPAVVVDRDRNVHVVWDESGQILYTKKALGGGWATPISGPNGIHAAGPPVLGIHENVLHLAWEDDAAGEADIFYTRKGPGRSWSLPWNISNNDGLSQHVDVAIDALDTVHVVWEDDSPGNFEMFYASKTAGEQWSEAVNITKSAANSLAADLLLDASGTLHMVWEEAAPGHSDIYYASKPPGGGWTAPLNISNSEGSSETPVIAMDGSEALHVVWKDSTPGNFEILYLYRPRGGGWSAPFNVSGNVGYSAQPSVAVDARDVLHLAWMDTTPGSYEILYASRSPGGTWSNASNLSDSAGHSSDPFLTLGPAGELVLAWRDNWGGVFDIYVESKTMDGWSEAENISNTPGAASSPALVSGADGVMHAFWEDTTPGQYEIFYASRRPIGRWTGAIDISNTPGQSKRPAAAVDSDNDPRLLWHEEVASNHEVLYSVRLNAMPYAPISPVVEGEANPSGVADLTPEFGWRFHDPDPGDVQSYYRILVASTVPSLTLDIGDLWDSGKVYSPQASDVEYGGKSLAWTETYYWKLRTWDSSDLEGDWSEPQHFAMNLYPSAPTNLLCEGEPSPQHLMTRVPAFSWEFRDGDADDLQGAYRILVATDPDLLSLGIGDMWDSGKVPSALFSGILYAGEDLAWGETYHWTAKTWDDHDLEGELAAAQSFRLMALPDPPHNPRCDGDRNPTGILNRIPTFTWTFYDADPGDTQTAYRLLVASSVEMLDADIGDRWDTGKVQGDSAFVIYGGVSLAWSSAYCWKVTTWDGTDSQGPFTAPQYFTTNTWPDAPRYAECDPTTRFPRFSWAFDDPDPEDVQSAYRILVASSEILLDAGLGDMWDSGKVLSPLSTDIVYSGQALVWGVRYYWKVAAWDRHDFPGPYCATQVFALDSPPHPPRTPLCEGQADPKGIPDATPEFSWTFADPDEGDLQGAFRILVASSSANLDADIGDMWDSGQVESSQSSSIPYEGAALSWKKRYYWKVRTWDRLGAAGDFCATQTFTMNGPPNRPASPLCEGRENPGAIRNPNPEFGWTFLDSDAGDQQGAYRILVATSAASLAEDVGDMWDSGKVISALSAGIPYNGAPLEQGQTFVWKVKVWDEHDLDGAYCNTQSFTTQTPMISIQPGYYGGVCPGWDQQYVVEVRNSLTRPLFDVHVVYQLSPLTMFYTAGESGAYDALTHQVTWRLGNMDAGEKRRLLLTLHISSAAEPGARLSHVATALSKEIAYDQVELGELVRDCSQLPTTTPTPTSAPMATPTMTSMPTLSPTPTWTPVATPQPSMGRIHGLVWEDLDHNGMPGENEPSMSGVTVVLDEKKSAASDLGRARYYTTAEDGYYEFDGLSPGTYILILVDPPGYFTTTFGVLEVLLGPEEAFLHDFGLCPMLRSYLPALSVRMPEFPWSEER